MLLSIVLSWNRPILLGRTIESYLKNTSIPHRLIVVDNGSQPETITLLKNTATLNEIKVVYLTENKGGAAFNHILDMENLKPYTYVHFSENDIEYLPGWDEVLIKKLKTFPEVGQLSPFSPFPQTKEGEYSWEKDAKIFTRNNQSIYLAKLNVGTTCLIRKEIIESGLRWDSLNTKEGLHFPHDGRFSRQIKKLGWKVAFNDQYVVKNWGHTITELQRDLDYYVKNHKGKSFHRFKERLKELGYKLKKKDGEFVLQPINRRR
ncbi:MAG: glycosyltransferase [Bacillus sp. (in: Bacteria)]|nr:glycosyltransferase [Bacillus sp. (in: firmicutes)]